MSKEEFDRAIREMNLRQQAIARMAIEAAQKRYQTVWGRAASSIGRPGERGGTE